MTRQASTAAKTAALIMMAPALLVPMKLSAQQMAAVSPATAAACDAIKDPAKSAQCHWDAEGAAIKARTAAAQQRGAAADVRTAAAEDAAACARFLLAKKAAGVILDATRLNRERGCIYARELGMQ